MCSDAGGDPKQEGGRTTRTRPDVHPSPCSAAPQFLFVCVPAWRHPPRYLYVRNNRKQSQCSPDSRDDRNRRQPEVATGTHFALYLGQHCDGKLSIGEARSYTVSAPHIKHSGLRGHAKTQVSRSNMQWEVKVGLSPRAEGTRTQVSPRDLGTIKRLFDRIHWPGRRSSDSLRSGLPGIASVDGCME